MPDLFAASAMDWLLKFPALWAVAGLILGGVATLIAVLLIIRKYGPAEKAAADRLADLQQRQLETMEATTKMQLEANQKALEMQRTHYEGELNELRKSATREVTEAKGRADSYEKQLHDRRNTWQAEKLEMTVEIEKLRARPDLGTLMDFEKNANDRNEKFFVEFGSAFKSQGETLAKVADTLDNVAKALTAHDDRIDERIGAVVQPVIDGMKEVVEAIHATQPTKKKRGKAELARAAG